MRAPPYNQSHLFPRTVHDTSFFQTPLPSFPMNTSETVQQNPEKDPSEWVTGDEPMTGPQMSYLKTLCHEAGEEFNEKLTKAEASKRIEELQQVTGRGQESHAG